MVLNFSVSLQVTEMLQSLKMPKEIKIGLQLENDSRQWISIFAIEFSSGKKEEKTKRPKNVADFHLKLTGAGSRRKWPALPR